MNNGEYRIMTREQFDDFISEHRTINEDIYNENKELFDEAVRQERIRIKRNSSQITAGNTIYPPFTTYQIEPIH